MIDKRRRGCHRALHGPCWRAGSHAGLRQTGKRQIVAELEAERKLVEANRELIARMEAKIKAKLAEVWGGVHERRI